MNLLACMHMAACFLVLGSPVAGGTSDEPVSTDCRTTHPMNRFPGRLATVLGIEIGEDTVSSVEQKLGDAKHISGGESEGTKICYKLGRAGSPAYVVFEFGPLGGFNYVTGYRASRSVERKTAADCAPVAGKGDLEPVEGLRLGITMAQFKKTLGPGACEQKDKIEYSYEGKRKMNTEEQSRFGERDPGVAENPYFDISAGIIGRFDHSRLREFHVYRTESY